MMNKKTFTLAELAKLLSGTVQGDPSLEIHSIAPLQEAQSGQITFLDNVKYRKFLTQTQATAVILAEDMADKCPCAAIVVKNPYAAYAMVATLFDHKPTPKPGIHPTAVIGSHCNIAPSASIGPHVILGDHVTIGENSVIQAGCVINDHAIIGDNCWFWPNVTVYHQCQIGHRAIIHSGVVIGSDGFGFAFNQGTWHKIPQIGTVIIGDDVEIGANTTIDRGALGNTIIGQGVKLDNQIQIGHNVEIGDHTVIAAHAGLAGSTKIGKYCRIGGMAGFAGHITITDQVAITAMSSVAQSIDKPGIYSSGIPAAPFQSWKKNMVRFSQLDSMARRLMQIERKLSKTTDEVEEEHS